MSRATSKIDALEARIAREDGEGDEGGGGEESGMVAHFRRRSTSGGMESRMSRMEETMKRVESAPMVGGMAMGMVGVSSEAHEEMMEENAELARQIVELTLACEEKGEVQRKLKEATRRAREAEASVAKLREEMKREQEDLATLVEQKGALQLENANLQDMVADLRVEKEHILDEKEEMHDVIEEMEEEMERLERSAQDMAALQAGKKGKAKGKKSDESVAAHTSFSRASSSFNRHRKESAEKPPMGSPLPATPEDKIVASTRTTSFVGSGGDSADRNRSRTASGETQAGSGGRKRAESKSMWPWSK